MSKLETIPVTTPPNERMRRLGRSRGGRVVGAVAALGLVGGMTTACGTLGCKLTAGRTDKENEITLSLVGDHKKNRASGSKIASFSIDFGDDRKIRNQSWTDYSGSSDHTYPKEDHDNTYHPSAEVFGFDKDHSSVSGSCTTHITVKAMVHHSMEVPGDLNGPPQLGVAAPAVTPYIATQFPGEGKPPQESPLLMRQTVSN